MIEAILRITTPAGKRGEVLGVFRSLKGPTEVATGCDKCWILQDIDDIDRLTFLMRWESEHDLKVHLRSARFRKLLPYIEMSVKPPEMEVSTVDQIDGMQFLLSVLTSIPE